MIEIKLKFKSEDESKEDELRRRVLEAIDGLHNDALKLSPIDVTIRSSRPNRRRVYTSTYQIENK